MEKLISKKFIMVCAISLFGALSFAASDDSAAAQAVLPDVFVMQDSGQKVVKESEAESAAGLEVLSKLQLSLKIAPAVQEVSAFNSAASCIVTSDKTYNRSNNLAADNPGRVALQGLAG